MPEGSLPPALTPELLEDSSFLQALHRVLMDMHVVEGALVCPETGRRFPIAEGVPNLMCVQRESGQSGSETSCLPRRACCFLFCVILYYLLPKYFLWPLLSAWSLLFSQAEAVINFYASQAGLCCVRALQCTRYESHL